MNEQELREAVSALADGELAPARAERTLDAVMNDPGLREQWRRHHLVSAVLNGQGAGVPRGEDLAARVREAIAGEPAPLPARRAPARRVPGGALALAACVAAVAVVAVLGLAGNEQGAQPPELAQAPSPPGPAARPAPGVAPGKLAAVAPAAAGGPHASPAATRMTWNDARPAVQARLNGYLLNHNEYLAGGVRGMLPYARVVAYDRQD